MRRITLALALVGAVAAGCGGNKAPANGGAKGTAGVNFTVIVNNQGFGTVTSSATPEPGGSVNPCPANTQCTWTFKSGTTVALTGTASNGNYFNGFFGECSGTSCSLSGNEDKYVVAYFSATPEVHPNFNDPNIHSAAYNAKTLDCAKCHGPGASGPTMADVASNAGLGIAPGCGQCHKGTGGPALVGAGEKCSKCHLATGTGHQARYDAFADGINPATTRFAAEIKTFAAAVQPDGSYTATVTFTLKKDGQPFTAAASTLKQRAMFFVSYDSTAKKFPTPVYTDSAPASEAFDPADPTNITFNKATMTLVDAVTGTWTMAYPGLRADPVASATNAFVYGYFGDSNTGITKSLEGNGNPGGRHYALMDNMVSVAKVLKGTINYTSTATVSGCERCHGKPYSKHGYRQASVAGLNDFVACKACHTDFRRGTDGGWYLLVDDRAEFVKLLPDGWEGATDALKTQYAYVANVMQDTHNSHAFEFAYPQSVANCTVCHEGKLNLILTDANFTATTCKSCHPVKDVGGLGKKAPALIGDGTTTVGIIPAANHPGLDAASLYANTATACNTCHKAGGTAKVFSAIHNGYNGAIYADAAGKKWADVFKATITGTTYNATTKELTVNFSVTGAATGGYGISNIIPQLMIAPYAFDTKDWAQSYFSQDFGAKIKTGVTLVTNGQTTGNWSVKVDLDAASTTWATQLGNGDIHRVEIGIRPWMTTTTTWAVLPAADPTTAPVGVEIPVGTQLTLNSVNRTFELKSAAFEDGFFGNAIVDAAKCNKCHEALGTTFHAAQGEKNRSGSVVMCRMCHSVRNGGSHIEMQSRSIDSYVHALHSFQKMDIKDVNFGDAVQAFEYEEHIANIYPNFSIQNCESCHNPGTYDVPAQDQSLASIISKAATLTGTTRALNNVAVVIGPASRACGSCHRSQLINETILGTGTAAAITELNAIDAHMGGTINTTTGIVTGNGYRLDKAGADATTAELDAVTAGLKAAGLLP